MRKIIGLFVLSVFIHIARAQDSDTLSKPFVLGRVIEMNSAVLSEKRLLNIYLPPGYADSVSARYPVIYLLDGSADEDFIHVSGIMQFLTFPWINRVPNSIVVGIANVDRQRDFTYPTTIEKDKKDFPTTGGSERFIQFIESELQPFIDATFRTTASRTIIGQSLGGLLATEILFTKPHLFNKYLIASPSLWWDNESLLQKKAAVLSTGYKDSVDVYVAVGNEGKQMQHDVDQLVNLLRLGFKKNLAVHSEHFLKEDHASIMHHAVYNGLCMLNSQSKFIRK